MPTRVGRGCRRAPKINLAPVNFIRPNPAAAAAGDDDDGDNIVWSHFGEALKSDKLHKNKTTTS